MSKDLKYSELYQEYNKLLTKNQQEIFELYYLCDLSLGEISEIKKISRQGVSDALAKTRESLENYENCLKLCDKKRSLLSVAQKFEDGNEKSALIELIKVL